MRGMAARTVELTEIPIPTDPAELAAHTIELRKRVRYLNAKIAKLEEDQRLARSERFGASSERGEPQYRLFDEAELAAAEDADPDVQPVTADEAGEAKPRSRRGGARRPLPPDGQGLRVRGGRHGLGDAQGVVLAPVDDDALCVNLKPYTWCAK